MGTLEGSYDTGIVKSVGDAAGSSISHRKRSDMCVFPEIYKGGGK